MTRSSELLRNRDFRCMLLSRLLMMTGWVAQDVIIGWQIYSLTHDPFMLGLTGLAEAIPAISCALFAGHIVDTGRPHRIFLICIGLLALNSLGLMLVGGSFVSLAGGIVPWLFIGIFLSGFMRSFTAPTIYSLLSQIIPRAQIPGASAMLSGLFQFATVTGPAVAGIVYGGYGAKVAWFLPVTLMSLSFLLLAGMSETPRRFRNARSSEPAVKNIKAGWRFILDNRVMLSVMSLDMFAVLLGGAVSMLPAIADQVLHVGSEGLGILRAASAVGAGIMALFLSMRPMRVIRGSTLLWVVAGFGVCIIGFGLSTSFWLSFLLLAASGAFDCVSMVIRSAIMQLLTPDAMRGRISAVNSMFIISSNEIGSFESGTAARFFGLVPSIVFGGVCTLLVAGITAIMAPKLLRTAVSTEEPGSTGT
jgi:MFS family permease